MERLIKRDFSFKIIPLHGQIYIYPSHTYLARIETTFVSSKMFIYQKNIKFLHSLCFFDQRSAYYANTQSSKSLCRCIYSILSNVYNCQMFAKYYPDQISGDLKYRMIEFGISKKDFIIIKHLKL